jgi:formamidopyrimidine-DNA glycosylase
MPEIPEVEAFKSYITSHALRKKIIDVKILDKAVIHKIVPAQFKKSLIGHAFASVKRVGKYLIIALNNSDKKLVMHFGLSGSLFYTAHKNDAVRFSRVQFIFKNAVLHWTCIRKFGKLWLCDDIKSISGLQHIGIDALAITKKQFLTLLSENEKRNSKVFLMDQRVIAGVGNEYSDEALFHAGIDPHRTISTLSKTDRQNLYKALHKILIQSIKVQKKAVKKPSAIEFFSKENRKSFPSTYLQAHRHIDMICPKNKHHTLKKTTIAGRTTYYCPQDQS